MALLTGTGLRINRFVPWPISIIQNGGRLPSSIFKIGNFNFRSSSDAHYASSCQISRRSVEPFWRYSRLWVFKMAATRHLGFSTVETFKLPVRFGGQMCIIVPNFAKIGRIDPEIWPIFDFQDGGFPPSWIFKIWKFQLAVRFRGPMSEYDTTQDISYFL